MGRPKDRPAVPSHFDWDLWLGTAADRPYHGDYHPYNWRGWRDFGTGAIGDMACHYSHPVFRALNLGHPTSVDAQGSRCCRGAAPLDVLVGMEREVHPKPLHSGILPDNISPQPL